MMSVLPTWARTAAFLLGAMAVGGILAVVVTATGIGRSPATPTASPPAVTAATDSASPEPSVATASPAPSPSLVPTATSSAVPSQDGTSSLPEGCFSDGLLREGESTELVVAEDLRSRLPLPHPFSEAYAYVGSSANEGFVSAFAECTGADPAEIRYGTVSGGLTEATIPLAIQVDGFTGPELARIFVDGYLHPQQRATLQEGHHDGWTYRYIDGWLAVTASPDTIYWYWVPPCCVEGPLFVERTFVDVVHQYLDLTRDIPADWELRS